MFKLNSVLLFFLSIFTLPGCSQTESKNPEKPNILLLMFDDMGYSDLGCYGSEIQTPNIDKLAEQGIRFTQMHNSARCCPTRASLLTGHHPQQAGIHGMGVNLSMNTPTIAEILKENGYHTGMTGKWHLSRIKPRNSIIIKYDSDHPRPETIWNYIGKASASNTPFRYWKKTIQRPMIWPKNILYLLSPNARH